MEIDRKQELINTIGFDPLDYSWIERELPENLLEKKWFQFQREKGGSFDDNWNASVELFNRSFKASITEQQAFQLTKKWKRYLLGAWNTIASQINNVTLWKQAAREFEIYHRKIEERMIQWSKEHHNNYPLVKTKKEVTFWHGPYFNECVERIPKLFTSVQCSAIKTNVVLRVTSYDSELKFIKLDFTPDIVKIIKGQINSEPWNGINLKADYVISVFPHEIETQLEKLIPF